VPPRLPNSKQLVALRTISHRRKVQRGTRSDGAAFLERPMGTFSHRDPFPPRIVCRHTYAQNVSLLGTAAAGVIGTTYAFGLNDLITTNGSTTHQPYGSDQIKALYGTYKVRACNIQIQVIADNANSGFLMTAINGPVAGITYAGIDIGAAAEEPTVSVRSCAPQNPSQTYNVRVDIARLCAITRKEFDANLNSYAADNTHSPSLRAALVLGAASATPSAQCALTVMLKLEFEAEWFDRILQPQS
jgi:hypothetical protein